VAIVVVAMTMLTMKAQTLFGRDFFWVEIKEVNQPSR
jgi:hypothetical protein